MLVPMSNLTEAIQVFHDNYDLYPLWLCPYKAYDYSDKASPAQGNDAVPHRGFLRRPANPSSGGRDGDGAAARSSPFDGNMCNANRAFEVSTICVRHTQVSHAPWPAGTFPCPRTRRTP